MHASAFPIEKGLFHRLGFKAQCRTWQKGAVKLKIPFSPKQLAADGVLNSFKEKELVPS